MSFDSTFDYTQAKGAISSQVSDLTGKIDVIDAELATLANVQSELLYIANDKTAQLTQTKNEHQTRVSFLNDVLSDIQAVEQLGASDKNTLYTFFSTYVSEPTKFWMSRMVAHRARLLADTGNVLGGGVSESEGMLLAGLLCEKYSKAVPKARIVHRHTS